jgi:hypothetical protein
VLDRVLAAACGLVMLGMAWRMATREFWTTEGARALWEARPQSRWRIVNLRLDQIFTRIVAPLLLGGLGLTGLAVAAFGLVE